MRITGDPTAKLLVLGLAAWILQSCAVGGAGPSSSREIVQLGGFWEGFSRTGCAQGTLIEPGRCGAVNRITFTLNQTGSDLTGKYTCRIGTMVCRNEGIDTDGTVRGHVYGQTVSMRVFFPGDGSSCAFAGRSSYTEGGGDFTCYQGGGIVEQGSWHLDRKTS